MTLLSMQTTSYFDSRPDARFFMIDVDGIAVSIRENLPTYGITNGEVWAACRIHNRLFERRFASIDRARREIARCVRDWIGARADTPTIGVWVPIRRQEYAAACPVCGGVPGQPCLDEEGVAMLDRKGTVIVVGAPWQPDPHEAEVQLSPLVHAGRSTAHHRSLHGESR
jgi:hypothetical protein